MKWTTKDGNTIDIKDMGDNHLKNSIAMLKRKIDSYPGYQVYCGNSEYAEAAVDQENMQNAESLFECQQAVATLEKELIRRKNDRAEI